MDKKYIFSCDDCKNSWASTDYNEDGTDQESDYATGAECPKCGSESIGGTQV